MCWPWAEALKREKPERTAAQVRRILGLAAGWAPSDRTLQRLFEMRTGGTFHGPAAGGQKPYLSVTWNNRGVSLRECRTCAMPSPLADGGLGRGWMRRWLAMAGSDSGSLPLGEFGP
jgi:hypothetical protein